MVKLTAGPAEEGSRIDRLLRKRLPLLGLSRIYGLIRKGDVLVDGKKVKQDRRLKEGEVLFIDIDESELSEQSRPPDALAKMAGTDFFKRNFRILYEDQSIIVCDKPAGLVVHSGSGHSHNDNLVDLATAYVMSKSPPSKKTQGHGTEAGTEIPVLMHRLDRDTSGVIMLAKNTGVVRILHDSMRAGKFAKQYIAVCHNRPPEYEGTVEVGMRRSDNGRYGMKMSVGEGGTMSSTAYRILEYQNDLSRLEILLQTGKTHQIRVHMAYLKVPILGDERYGDARLDEKFFASKSASVPRRLYLHAHKLSFPHPKTKKQMTVTAQVPREFVLALEK
jgi:RluA family pseudouridine synthase